MAKGSIFDHPTHGKCKALGQWQYIDQDGTSCSWCYYYILGNPLEEGLSLSNTDSWDKSAHIRKELSSDLRRLLKLSRLGVSTALPSTVEARIETMIKHPVALELADWDAFKARKHVLVLKSNASWYTSLKQARKALLAVPVSLRDNFFKELMCYCAVLSDSMRERLSYHGLSRSIKRQKVISELDSTSLTTCDITLSPNLFATFENLLILCGWQETSEGLWEPLDEEAAQLMFGALKG